MGWGKKEREVGEWDPTWTQQAGWEVGGPTGDMDMTWRAHTHTHYKGLTGRGARNAITEPKRHCSSRVSSPLLLSKYLEERSE